MNSDHELHSVSLAEYVVELRSERDLLKDRIRSVEAERDRYNAALEPAIDLLEAIQRVACREGLRGIEEDCFRMVRELKALQPAKDQQ